MTKAWGGWRALQLTVAVMGVFTIGCGGGRDTSGVKVSEATWTDGRWPLTVASGRLSCEGTSARPVPWFESPDGLLWPLNGIAMGEAERRGGVFQTDLTPIHAVDEDFIAELREAGASEDGPIVRISVAALGNRARSLCE